KRLEITVVLGAFSRHHTQRSTYRVGNFGSSGPDFPAYGIGQGIRVVQDPGGSCVSPAAASRAISGYRRPRSQACATARTSLVNRAGGPRAAKWPPRAGWFQCTMLAKRRCAQRREGRGTSLGKMLHPAGTVTVSLAAVVNQPVTWAMLSQYSRAEDAAV